GDILLLAKTGIAANLSETQGFPLVQQAAVRHRELLLEATQLEIVARHFRRDADAHVIDIRREAVGGRSGRAHLGSNAAEYIDLPERVEAETVGVHPDWL